MPNLDMVTDTAIDEVLNRGAPSLVHTWGSYENAVFRNKAFITPDEFREIALTDRTLTMWLEITGSVF